MLVIVVGVQIFPNLLSVCVRGWVHTHGYLLISHCPAMSFCWKIVSDVGEREVT